MDRYITTPHNFIWREKEPEKNSNEIGYAIVTKDDSRTHILCKADEKYMKIHNS